MLRRLPKSLLLTIALAAVLGYFLYHSLYGGHGLADHEAKLKALETVEQELAAIKVEREQLERRVALMRPQSLDPDMLDEQARLALGFVRRDELIILLPDETGRIAQTGRQSTMIGTSNPLNLNR